MKLKEAVAAVTDVKQMFATALANGKVKHFKKYGTVLARPAKDGERVITVINGVKETENVAKSGDYVVQNPGGEQYIISADKLNSRYKKATGGKSPWRAYTAKGECWGFKYNGTQFTFKAPWGEDMLVQKGDMIVSTNPKGGDDIYRIEKKAFAATYKPA